MEVRWFCSTTNINNTNIFDEIAQLMKALTSNIKCKSICLMAIQGATHVATY
jgi:hypothetical protein